MIPIEISDAAVNNDKDAVAAWLAANPQSVNDLNAYGSSLLISCINASPRTNRDDQLELLRYLLSQGADPNLICGLPQWPTQFPAGTTALFDISNGHDFPELQQFVDCLLCAGADPNLKVAENAPLFSALDCFLGADEGSWILPVVAHLLRYGASLDNCEGNRSAEEVIAEEERRWPELVQGNLEFQAAAILIRGVRAAGSWKKYCRKWGPHRDILRLRSLVVRGRGTTSDTWLAGMVRLKENGLVWKVLSFWRDPDDVARGDRPSAG